MMYPRIPEKANTSQTIVKSMERSPYVTIQDFCRLQELKLSMAKDNRKNQLAKLKSNKQKPHVAPPTIAHIPIVEECNSIPEVETLTQEDTQIQKEDSMTLKRLNTKEMMERFQNITWKTVDKYKAHVGKLEQENMIKKGREQISVIKGALDVQVKEKEIVKEIMTHREKSYAAKILEDVEKWKESELKKEQDMQLKRKEQKQNLDVQMEQLKLQVEQQNKENAKEAQELKNVILREMEETIKAKQAEKEKKRAAMNEIIKMTEQERALAAQRTRIEQEEDVKLLQKSIAMEKELERKRLAERQKIVEAHQARVELIASNMKNDKLEKAIESCLRRYERDQIRLLEQEKKNIEEHNKKVKDNIDYILQQQKEKEIQRATQIKENRALQNQFEIESIVYKQQLVEQKRKQRENCVLQQQLLEEQIKEHQSRKEQVVSATEMKLNRELLEKVLEFQKTLGN